MFFEEESKDTHRDMDDYDLDFEQDESVSWDELLDDKEITDPSKLKDEPDSLDTRDDLIDSIMDMDDASYDSFLEQQSQNISSKNEIKNIEPTPPQTINKPEVVDNAPKIEPDNLSVSEVLSGENNAQISIKEPNNEGQLALGDAISDSEQEIEEDTEQIQQAFGYDKKDTQNVEVDDTDNGKIVQDDYDYSDDKDVKKPKQSKNTLVLGVIFVILLIGVVGYRMLPTIVPMLSSIPGISAVTSTFIQSEEPNFDQTFTQDGANIPSAVQSSGQEDSFGVVSNNTNANNQQTEQLEGAFGSFTPNVPQNKSEVNVPEEKVNLKIVDSGRQTPFVPVANVNNIGFITSPKISIPAPFTTLAEPDPMLDKLMEIVVSGILYDGSSNPSAVINVSGVDYFVQKGDKIDTFTVIGITRDKVVIKEKSNIFSASIGQNFTNAGRIAGETRTINTSNRQIHRQYTTLEDVGINVN